MTEVEKQAVGIHELICESGRSMPLSGNGVVPLIRALNLWRAENPGLDALRRALPQVQLCFLSHSMEWLQAEARVDGNLGVCPAVSEGIRLALVEVPKPLPAELVSRLLNEYRQSLASMAQIYFPFAQLLSLLTPDQVTEEMRAELRRLHLHFAPSPTGKIDDRTQEIRSRIADLLHVEGAKVLDIGRGPWSQIVFEEIGAMDEITRSGWETLLEHCRFLEQTIPGAKWRKRSRELADALGEANVASTLLRWLALGPTPNQLPEARSPIEDSAYQKGVVWCLGLCDERQAAVAIGDFGLACLRKIRLLGAVSQKVGFACVQALGGMNTSEAISQLTRLRAKVKYSVARRLIEKSLQQAAERNGLAVEQLEDISVDRYGLSSNGVAEIVIGSGKVSISLDEDGRVRKVWYDADGKPAKSPAPDLKRGFGKEVRSATVHIKELEQALSAQRARLESWFFSAPDMPIDHWRKHFLEHPLLGFLGRRLIWVFRNNQGWEQSGMGSEERVDDSSGKSVDLNEAKRVSLWHPLSSDSVDIERWRERVFATGIRQPFPQAFREFYQVTDDERQTQTYSNRFAGVLMRQHQFASLCRTRGWDYRLMGAHFDGSNVPTKKLPSWNIHVEFYVDLPSDRDDALRRSGLGEQSGAGINLFIGSDQVRFYRSRKEVPIAEVPAIVYSEIMRDVDLFTSVCAVGNDETWTEQGDRGLGVFGERFDVEELSALTSLRAEILARLLPHTTIADRCQIQKNFLEVRGQLGTYRISLTWSGAALVTDEDMRWLKIPPKILDAIDLNLTAIPIEIDHRTEMTLRKAYLLANDWRIDSPELIRQLMRH